jgi:hypothetical protein
LKQSPVWVSRFAKTSSSCSSFCQNHFQSFEQFNLKKKLYY